MMQPTQTQTITNAQTDKDGETLLLPPVESMLRLAVRGWADVHEMQEDPTPRPHVWMPPFIRLLATPGWLNALCYYAMRGARRYGAGEDMLDCISRAFDKPDTGSRLICELARRLEKTVQP
jgi:hypothetical protein